MHQIWLICLSSLHLKRKGKRINERRRRRKKKKEKEKEKEEKEKEKEKEKKEKEIRNSKSSIKPETRIYKRAKHIKEGIFRLE